MNKLWTLAFGTLVLGLTACGSNGIEGIWVISLDADSTSEYDYDCSENFSDAACPAEGEEVESEWTFTEQYESSPGLMMVEIVGGPRGEAFMFMNDQVVPGTKDDLWTFEFDSFEDESTTSTHETGYRYSERDYYSSKVTITFSADLGGHAEGVIQGTSENTARWQESDTWDSDAMSSWGQIPASSYLEGDGNYNSYEESDCEGDPCNLELTQIVTSWTRFTSSRTELNEGADFTAVEHDGSQ